MPKFSVIDLTKAGLLVPLVYGQRTRYDFPRGFGVNAITAWVPGVILLAGLSGANWGAASLSYALGYIAFFCLYEIGYMVNDSYGLRHDPTPRPRCPVPITIGFAALFVALRLSVFVLLLSYLGLWTAPIYLGAVAALVVVLVLHNLLRQVELKVFSFVQLSLLRFLLPILPALLLAEAEGHITTVLATGGVVFTLPRLLTYLDATGRLTLPERKERPFYLQAHLASAPLVAVIALVADTPAPIFVLGWLILAQVVYVLLGARRSAMRPTQKASRA